MQNFLDILGDSTLPKTRSVSERDLRVPEFRDAKVEDLEMREDGKIVRKDRFQVGMRNIAYELNIGRGRTGYEVPDVVAKVKDLVQKTKIFGKSGFCILNALGQFLSEDESFEDSLAEALSYEHAEDADQAAKDAGVEGYVIKYVSVDIAINISDLPPQEVANA